LQPIYWTLKTNTLIYNFTRLAAQLAWCLVPFNPFHAPLTPSYCPTLRTMPRILTFIFGFVGSITNSMRNSILILVVFFLLGYIVLSFMKKTDFDDEL
jgi:hypothetical protein